jgi:glutamine synthetase
MIADTSGNGFDNKEAALRVVSRFYQREEQSYNIEFKASDGSANPYLSLGALIACGLDGIDRQLEPGEPCERDPALLSVQELERGCVRQLPSTMGAALEELEKDQFLLGTMGDLLSRCYLRVRHSENDAFSAEDEEFEMRNHFYRF